MGIQENRQMKAIFELTLPGSCFDCPLCYDDICCNGLDDGDDAIFQKDFEPDKNRLPNCPLKTDSIKQKKDSVFISGKKYVSTAVFREAFGYNNGNSEYIRAIKDGLPYKTIKDKKYFNFEDCEAWHRGEL